MQTVSDISTHTPIEDPQLCPAVATPGAGRSPIPNAIDKDVPFETFSPTASINDDQWHHILFSL